MLSGFPTCWPVVAIWDVLPVSNFKILVLKKKGINITIALQVAIVSVIPLKTPLSASPKFV